MITPFPRRSLPPSGGFSVTEVMVVVVIVGILSAVGINASGNEWRREQVNAVAIELSGWLETVRRSALRGNSCAVTINGGSLSAGGTLATATENTGTAFGSGAAIGNNCLTGQPLTISGGGSSATSYTIAPSGTTQLTFTPRGTVNATAADTPITSPIEIRIALTGSTGPMRCVRISPGLGMVAIGASNTSGTSCPSASYGGSF